MHLLARYLFSEKRISFSSNKTNRTIMKTLKNFTLLILLSTLLTSCAKIYYSSDAYDLARNHKTIAILPPTVSIAANRNLEPEAKEKQEVVESMNFQKEMYFWLLRRKMKEEKIPEIQDIETTNIKLEKAGYPDSTFTSAELCEILDVDAILGSNYSLSKPLTEEEAIVVGILFDTWMPTNEVIVAINIKDCANTKLIWNYDHRFSGTVGSNPTMLVDRLMRKASKKIPYQ